MRNRLRDSGRSAMRARLMLRRGEIDVPGSGCGVVIVDGSVSTRAGGVGGWMITGDGHVEHWCRRVALADISTIEISALVYGAHRAMAHDQNLRWSIYSDRSSVAEELVEASPTDPLKRVIDWILAGRVVVHWTSRDTEAIRSADALARAGRFLPENPVHPMRLADRAKLRVDNSADRVDGLPHEADTELREAGPQG